MMIMLANIIFAIVFILALTYIIGCLVARHEVTIRKKYQDHIAALVEELFPPDIPTLQPAIQVPTTNESYESDTQEDTVQYTEAKRKMVADLRTYFNQRKINAAIRDTEIAIREAENKTGLHMNSPMFSSGPDTTPLPTPPSLQRILE